ncbi:hypothetical protein GCM10009677_06690 [Sphaerisporangium rubeum]
MTGVREVVRRGGPSAGRMRQGDRKRQEGDRYRGKYILRTIDVRTFHSGSGWKGAGTVLVRA